jgi:hypothetical protein
MWNGLIDWAQEMMIERKPQLASPEDFEIPVCVNSVEEVIEILKVHQTKWEGQ